MIKEVVSVLLIAAGALAAVAGVALIVIFLVASIVITLVCFVIPAIALAVMGKRAGFKFWWLSFIPVGQLFVKFILPRENYKLLFINTRKRFIPCIIYGILLAIEFPLFLICMSLPEIGIIAIPIFLFFLYAFRWRMVYDLMYIYYQKDTSTVTSIIGTVIPPFFGLMLIINMFHKPKFGLKNYYNNEWTQAAAIKAQPVSENAALPAAASETIPAATVAAETPVTPVVSAPEAAPVPEVTPVAPALEATSAAPAPATEAAPASDVIPATPVTNESPVVPANDGMLDNEKINSDNTTDTV